MYRSLFYLSFSPPLSPSGCVPNSLGALRARYGYSLCSAQVNACQWQTRTHNTCRIRIQLDRVAYQFCSHFSIFFSFLCAQLIAKDENGIQTSSGKPAIHSTRSVPNFIPFGLSSEMRCHFERCNNCVQCVSAFLRFCIASFHNSPISASASGNGRAFHFHNPIPHSIGHFSSPTTNFLIHFIFNECMRACLSVCVFVPCVCSLFSAQSFIIIE